MSFLAELRRRNDLRVLIAYLAGAWLLLQIADIAPELGHCALYAGIATILRNGRAACR